MFTSGYAGPNTPFAHLSSHRRFAEVGGEVGRVDCPEPVLKHEPNTGYAGKDRKRPKHFYNSSRVGIFSSAARLISVD